MKKREARERGCGERAPVTLLAPAVVIDALGELEVGVARQLEEEVGEQVGAQGEALA